MTTNILRVERLGEKDLTQLSGLFAVIAGDSTALAFHPHPFTTGQAEMIALHKGRDIYLGAFINEALIGYGMLRGWDSGYQIPSLGIYLSPNVRRRGLAAVFMSALHQYARDNGAEQVMLKVYPTNSPAIKLYEGIGYKFEAKDAGQLVGYFNLLSSKVIF